MMDDAEAEAEAQRLHVAGNARTHCSREFDAAWRIASVERGVAAWEHVCFNQIALFPKER
jgi:hypothetical protein